MFAVAVAAAAAAGGEFFWKQEKSGVISLTSMTVKQGRRFDHFLPSCCLSFMHHHLVFIFYNIWTDGQMDGWMQVMHVGEFSTLQHSKCS
jgi:hypothetical protein